MAGPAPLGGSLQSSPETPMVSVLPLNHAPGDFALPAPIDRRARRPVGYLIAFCRALMESVQARTD